MKKLIIILMFPFSVLADTERLAPDTLITQTNLTGAVTAIDEDPSSPGGDWLTEVDDGLNTVAHVSFPSPTGDLNAGAGLQTFKLYVRRSTEVGGNDPTITVALYESGSIVSTLLTTQSVTSLTGELITITWDATLLAGISGANAEVHATGNRSGGAAGSRRTVEFDAIDWVADYSAAGAAGQVIIISQLENSNKVNR